jgi:hypothetical protein
VRIVVSPVADLTPAEYRACYRANYRDIGIMRYDLVRARDENEGTAIMLWNDDGTKESDMLGWALVHPTHYDDAATSYARRRVPNTAQYWVKRQHRRKGLGTKLATVVEQNFGRVRVYPHSEPSGKLFKKKSKAVYSDRASRFWLKD